MRFKIAVLEIILKKNVTIFSTFWVEQEYCVILALKTVFYSVVLKKGKMTYVLIVGKTAEML